MATYVGGNHGLMCPRCIEYEITWKLEDGGYCCKYCYAEERSFGAPVPQYMRELIPLE